MTWLSDRIIEHLRQLPDMPETVGARYRILEEVARGGMGTVYLALDTELERRVALKVLQLSDPSGAEAERMMREARIVARLEHPAIVPVHDVGTLPDGRVFYVMKLVRGSRLDQYAADSLADFLRVFLKICEAVAFAHSNGVIHRDLKPENIMVGPFGEVLVMDWGLARVLRRAGTEPEAAASYPHEAQVGSDALPAFDTAPGIVAGTPGYMAPEQAAGAGGQDERTDVYALGAILHFILTGRPPVDSGPDAQVRRHALLRSLRVPREPDFAPPRPLQAICLKALAWDGDLRYPTVVSLSTDVNRFLAGRSVSAHRESLIERGARWAWRYRTPILLVLAYLLMRALLFFFTRR